MYKYDHLIHSIEKQPAFWGDVLPSFMVYFRGHDCMPDSNLYASYGCYMKENFIDRWPHFHTEDEYLCFNGYDMADPWSSFDAEIEFWIGKDRYNMERHIITEPTIVRLPPFIWHCPLEFTKVKKPVYFQVVCPRGKFGGFLQRPDENGNSILEYSGSAGAKPCNLDKTKQCIFCGKCAKPNEDEPKTAAEALARINAERQPSPQKSGTTDLH